MKKRARPADAEAAFREALRLEPGDPVAHFNFANLLKANGKPVEAETEHRQALRLKPDFAEARCNLGQLLVRAGRYAEAVPELRRGHEIGMARKDWRYPSAQWVRNAEQLAAFDARLPAVLAGAAQPAGADEWIQFARLTQHASREQFAAAVRFYTEAFAADPKVADNLTAAHRYNAACAAALAGAGKGRDAASVTEAERTRLRRQALEWLRADLAAYTSLLDAGKPGSRTLVEKNLSLWQRDTDLTSVRDAAALTGLAAAERETCAKLWADVRALLVKARAAK